MLRTIKASVMGKLITLEVAETEDQQAIGFMYRKSLPADRGMLFVFPEARNKVSFTMENVNFPLSLLLLDRNKRVIDAQGLHPGDGPRDIECPVPCHFAIEVPPGWEDHVMTDECFFKS